MTVSPPATLSHKHKLAALLEARGEMSVSEIAEAIGLGVPRLSYIRNHSPEYKLLVEKYREELVERTLDLSAQLLADFNREAPNAFKSLVAIHKDSGAREGARVAAAKEILDRSTVAPRKREGSEGGESGVHIHIGVESMSRIRAALEDTEDEDTIELLEGDYTVEESTDVDSPITTKEAP